jgi:biopolymer transport protein ExbD
MAISSGGGGSIKSDINVTPLVDVMLVLLIIFMVVTPMLQKGRAVQLPQTSDPPAMPESSSQTLVSLTREGKIWIETDEVAEPEFEAKIRYEWERSPNNSVVIKADANLTYGDVKKRMMQVKAAGFDQVGLITSRRDQMMK